MKKESVFERETCKLIRSWHPDIRVFKMDPSSAVQGVPDRIVLFRGKFAMLEFKRNSKALHQPNQDWYVDFFNNEGFARFIYPENGEQVLEELSHYLHIL